MKYAMLIWLQALVIVVVLPIHALLPNTLVHTASNALAKINLIKANRLTSKE